MAVHAEELALRQIGELDVDLAAGPVDLAMPGLRRPGGLSGLRLRGDARARGDASRSSSAKQASDRPIER